MGLQSLCESIVFWGRIIFKCTVSEPNRTKTTLGNSVCLFISRIPGIWSLHPHPPRFTNQFYVRFPKEEIILSIGGFGGFSCKRRNHGLVGLSPPPPSQKGPCGYPPGPSPRPPPLLGDPPLYTREMGTICPFGFFSPVLWYFLLGNWPFSLLNVVFWELEKAIFGPEKDKWWIWGFQDPQTTWNAYELGKTSQHHNWPRYRDCPQIGPKRALTGEKKRQRTNGTYFARPPTPPPWSFK